MDVAKKSLLLHWPVEMDVAEESHWWDDVDVTEESYCRMWKVDDDDDVQEINLDGSVRK